MFASIERNNHKIYWNIYMNLKMRKKREKEREKEADGRLINFVLSNRQQ